MLIVVVSIKETNNRKKTEVTIPFVLYFIFVKMSAAENNSMS